MATKLYVGGLSYDTTSEQLKAFFEQAGAVVSAAVVTDRDSGRSRGFGFVEMATEAEAQKAIRELNGKTFGERRNTVDEARASERQGGGQRPFRSGPPGPTKGGRRW